MTRPEVDPTLLMLRVSANVSMSPDMDHPAVEYVGEILLMDESFTDETVIGEIAYRTVPAYFAPDEDNEAALDALDELDADALHVGEVVDTHLESVAPDGMMGLLLIDTIWVDPAYRGQGVAAHALWRLLKLFEGNMMPDHAVAHLVPIDKPNADAPWERVADKDPEEARHRLGMLHDLFERSGFKRVGKTDVVHFPLEREARLPSATVWPVPKGSR